MHLWPTARIRDSFKLDYLKKLEWNLHRMNSDKKAKSQSRTVDDDNQQSLMSEKGDNSSSGNDGKVSKAVAVCKEVLLVLSCCYCCFCCGGQVGSKKAAFFKVREKEIWKLSVLDPHLKDAEDLWNRGLEEVEENVVYHFDNVLYWLCTRALQLGVEFGMVLDESLDTTLSVWYWLRKSMKDSIMMNSLFMAMNKSHEKLKSRQGVIGRLIEISKFYELAVMQLDGCLKIVEEETESLSLSLEVNVNHEEVMSDLYVIRDRLQRRLDDTELTIMNTDSCLAERFENELKLREALEMKEKELVSLQGDLDQLERTKSEGHQILSKNLKIQVGGVDDGKAGDISQLKNSVDMKFCSFKQMFEERKFSVESSQIDQLSSDIDRLKESLDLAFGKMQNAIFLSAVEPAEHEWRWSIEKDVMLMSAKGLNDDFHDIHETAIWKLNYFSLMMDEIRSLRGEFEQLMREKEKVVSPSPSVTDFRVKIPLGTKERPPLDDKKGKNDERAKFDHFEDGGNYVAKLITTHERIIQKKIEEQRAKEKLIRERWYSAMKKDKQPDGLNKKIQDVIARLDNIINMNHPLSKFPGEVHEDIVKPKPLRRFASESELEFRNIVSSSLFCQVDDDLIGHIRTLETVKDELVTQSLIMEEVQTVVLRDCIEQCHNDFDVKIDQLYINVRMLEKETKNYEVKSTLLEEASKKFETENEELRRKINIVEQENFLELENFEAKSTILEEVYAVLIVSTTTEQRNELEKMSASKALFDEIIDKFTEDFIATNIELQTSTAIFRDKLEYINYTEYSVFAEELGKSLNVLGGEIQQRRFAKLYELFYELSNSIDDFVIENLIKEQIYRVVFEETIRDIVETHTSKQSELQVVENHEESSRASEEVNEGTSAFQEMVDEWKMNQSIEILLYEDIYQFLVKEAAKDAFPLSITSEDSLSGTNLIDRLENEEDSLIRRLDYLLKSLESDQELESGTIPEIMEQNSDMDQNSEKYLDPQGIDTEESGEDLLVDDDIAFSSVKRKFEDALHQLNLSSQLITELRFDLGMNIDQAAPDIHTISNEDDSISMVTSHNLHKNKKLIAGLNSSAGIDIDQEHTSLDSTPEKGDSVYLPTEPDSGAESRQSLKPSKFIAISEVINEFERTTHTKLDSTSLRLETIRHHLMSLLDHVGSLRKNEALYKNAFMRRCHDLHLAEAEVDLLGDQVDTLLTLLEKIYWTLYRHSPALRQYFEVQELMNLIKMETNCGGIINPQIAS